MSLANRTLLNHLVGRPTLSTAAGTPLRTETDALEAAARLKQTGWYDFTLRKRRRCINGRMVDRWSIEAGHLKITEKACFSLMPMRLP